MDTSVRIGVIGGGAAGITAVKELVERGVDVIAFEKGDRVGGLWVQDATGTLTTGDDVKIDLGSVWWPVVTP